MGTGREGDKVHHEREKLHHKKKSYTMRKKKNYAKIQCNHRFIRETKCNIDHSMLIGIFFFHLEIDDLIYQLYISMLLVH